MYRVAEFKKSKGRQIFTGFSQIGYQITPDGKLYEGNKLANVSDKRRQGYREVNKFSGRYDLGGCPIFDRDIVYNKTENQFGVIRFLPYKAAFVMMLKAGKVEIPYSFLDCYSVSLIKVGTEYEKNIKNIEKKC